MTINIAINVPGLALVAADQLTRDPNTGVVTYDFVKTFAFRKGEKAVIGAINGTLMDGHRRMTELVEDFCDQETALQAVANRCLTLPLPTLCNGVTVVLVSTASLLRDGTTPEIWTANVWPGRNPPSAAYREGTSAGAWGCSLATPQVRPFLDGQTVQAWTARDVARDAVALAIAHSANCGGAPTFEVLLP